MQLTPLVAQAHVLRTSRIRIKGYLRYCRKLSVDRAVIAERGRQESIDESQTNGVVWAERRVARIVAYDESTGSHVVRYASHIRSVLCGGSNMGEGEELNSLGEMIDFNGGEARLILAGRDYLIICRDGDGFEDEGNTYDGEGDGDDEVRVYARSRASALR